MRRVARFPFSFKKQMSGVENEDAARDEEPTEAKAGKEREPRHAMATRSFKLRFAAYSEPGRSNLSAVRPLGLPAPVTDKLYARTEQRGTGQMEAEARALSQVRARFDHGPRDLYPHPITTAHEYGWWCAGESAADRHHIRDSAWLRTRLRLLAPDAGFKRC